MKRLIALLVVIGLMVSGVAFAKIDRDSPLSSKTVIATGVMVGHGATVYKLFFWASAASSYFALYDCATVGDTNSNDKVKMEGGEATQYDGNWYDFGEDGIVFQTGVTAVITTGGYVTILYQ